MERLLTIKEVAELLSVSEKHVRRLYERGEFLKPVRLGGAIRWRHQSVAEWISEKYEHEQQESTPAIP